MNKFNVGDTIKIVKQGDSSQSRYDYGKIGKIIKLISPHNYRYAYGLDIEGGGVWEDEIELFSTQPQKPRVYFIAIFMDSINKRTI